MSVLSYSAAVYRALVAAILSLNTRTSWLLFACLVVASGHGQAAEAQRGIDPAGLPFGMDLIPSEERATGPGRAVRTRLMRWNMKYQMVQSEEPADFVQARRSDLTRMKIADHLIVKLKPGIEGRRLRALAAELGMRVRRQIGRSDSYLVSFPVFGHRSLELAQRALAGRAEIASVGVDWVIQLAATPSDSSFDQLWGMLNTGQSGGVIGADIKATQAWNISTGNRNVVVGIIDTGIDYNHPDLAANMWTNPHESGPDSLGRDKRTNGVDDDGNGYIDDWRGWDFVNNDNDPMDDNAHGTHCAGTIGGVGNNGQGVAGVCWQVSLVGLKFLSGSGSGAISDAVEAMQYSANMPFTMTSNSWGGGGFDQSLKDAIDLAGSRGQLFVAAAGNSTNNNDASPSYPSSYLSDNIIAVAATDRYDQLASFSSYGANSVDVGAPGVDIFSCQPGNRYQLLSGTSMATPHVAGACALLKSVNPSLTGSQIKQAIMAHADPIPGLMGKCVTNARLNLYASLTAVAGPSIGLQAQSVVEEANGDGLLNPGENAALILTLVSAGSEPVINAVGRISTSDSAVTILTDSVSYGTLSPGQTSTGNGVYRLRLAPGTPTPRVVALTLTVTSATGSPWVFPVTTTYVTSATITGYVRRATGAVIPGATVAWSGTTSGQVVASTDGAYSILVGDGTYTVTARASGFLNSAPITVTTPSSRIVDPILGFVDIEVTPTNLAFTVEQGQTGNANLTVANLGDAALSWNIATQSGSNWLPTGLWHQTTYRSPDGQQNWYYGRDDTHTYDTGAANQGSVTCGSVLIPTGTPTLSFRQWRQTEGGSSFDVSTVEVSTNQGVTWTTVSQVIDNSFTWVNATVSLSAYAGQMVSLRFRFNTVDSALNQYEGWYVGDIRLNGQPFGGMLTAAPSSGILMGGQQASLTVTAMPGQRPPGVYDEQIRVTSNDPATPEMIVPVTIQVTGAPLLTAGTPSMNDDATAPSAGDGDSQAEPGETIEIRTSLTNNGAANAVGVQVVLVTSSPYVTISNNTTTYPSMVVGGIGQPQAPFVVAMAAACPNNTVIPFTMNVSDAAGRHWPTTFSITVSWASRLSGIVALNNGAVLAGATVTVAGISAITATDGTYAINGIPAGNFTATATKTGYVSVSQGYAFPPNQTWNPQFGTKNITVTPASLSAQLQPGQTGTGALSLAATGTLPVTWTASASAPGGGYQVTTSDQAGGPNFVWNDISATGTLVTGLSDDNNVGPFPIGFAMPFYGQSFTNLRVCSNGWVSFTSIASTYPGMLLPNSSAPENLIAALWRDLYPPGGGTVHYRQVDSGTFIIQFTNIPRLGYATSLCTFQIVLKANGTVLLYYQRTDDPTIATAGMQNAARTVGVTLAYNQTFLHANLAVRLQPSATWLSVSPSAGTAVPGAPVSVVATYNTAGLAYGRYTASLTVTSDATNTPNVVVPVTLDVISAHAPVAVPVVTGGNEDQPVAMTLLGSDADGDPLIFTILTQPIHGTVSGSGAQYTYVPHANWNGTDTFTYQVSDGYQSSAPATVTMTLVPMNDAPVMLSRVVKVISNTSNSFNLNATDVDGDTLTYATITLPAHGQMLRNGAAVSYTPELGFLGDDHAAFTVTDGVLTTSATITFRVVDPSRDWPTLGNGPDHTGFRPEPVGAFTALTPLWTASFDQPINQVAVGDGSIYVTPITYFGNTYLATLDVVTGTEQWRRTFTSAYSMNPPTFHEGSVYVQRGNHSSDTQLWRLSAVDGATIWQAPHAAQWERYLAPTIVGDRVWVNGGYFGGMYGFDRNTGAQINFLTKQQYSDWTPTAANGQLYAWAGSEFAVHDPITGALLWSLTPPGSAQAYSSTAVVADAERAYLFATYPTRSLTAIDLTTHAVVWSRNDAQFRGLPALADGMLFMYGTGGIVTIDAATGTLGQTYALPGAAGTSLQPIVTPDAVMGSSDTTTSLFSRGGTAPRQSIPFGGHLSLAGNRLLIAAGPTLRAYRMPISVTWTVASQTSANESGVMMVTAQLSAASDQLVTVPFTTTGTATGVDYLITASPITIAAGATTGTATMTITADTVDETDETVILTMGTPTNATLGATTVHTATITDDDTASMTSISPTSGTTAGGTTVTVTGTNLTGTSAVTFGGTAATSVTVVSATSVTCVTPAGAAGPAVAVAVTTPGGTGTLPSAYTYRAPPTITTHPANTEVTAGQTATFTVVASGAAPLTYQWKQGVTNVGTNSATLSITNAQEMNVDSYTCVVTNDVGSATSNGATLTLNGAYNGVVLREWWNGISGVTIASLTSNAAYPNSPTGSGLLNIFEIETNTAENYGTRIRGYVIPPTTGNYTFWIAGDDNCELWLSTNTNPANRSRIAYVSSWTNSRVWTALAGQQSALIPLIAGQKYYIEALHKEAGGGDNLAVGWQLPDLTMERPIPGVRLEAFAPTTNIAPTITSHPTSVAVTAGQTATFTVVASSTAPLTYQWKLGTIDVGSNSATLSITNAQSANAGSYTCVVTNSAGTVTSNAAMLMINSTNPPLYQVGLRAEFFDSATNLSVIPNLGVLVPDVVRTDAQIAYASVNTAWAGLPSTMVDTFSSRHSGWLKIDTAGTYTLFINSDDGSRVYLNGAVVIDNDGLHGMQERSVTLSLAAGFHQLRVEFFENTGGCGLEFSWSGPGIAKQMVPASALWQSPSSSVVGVPLPWIAADVGPVNVAGSANGNGVDFSITGGGSVALGTTSSTNINDYTLCANEGQSFALPGICEVAYGANGVYVFRNNLSGTVVFNNATFGDPISGVVKKGYYRLGGTQDAFQMVYRPLTGNGELIARVVSLENTNTAAKAGVMVRDSITASSVNAFMAMTPTSGATFQSRTATSGVTASTLSAGIVAPYWVRVVRIGTTVSGWMSSDGITWTQVGAAVTLPLGASPVIGLGVTGGNNDLRALGIFDQVLFIPYAGG